MRKPSVRSVAILVTLCCLAVGVASASSVTNLTKLTISPITPATTVTLTFPFPTAGDAYCSATNGCGTIPSGGQTDFQWTAGDFVLSSIFVVPNSTGATGLTANWSFQDFLGGGNTETWFVLVNGVAVAQAILPDDAYNGDIGTVTGSVTFGSIGPVAGGYQIELVLQNTVPFGGGSAAWLDGGTTGLTVDIVSTIPEPSSMLLVGTGVIGLAGLMRRKLGL
ncbi:MAG TPA: PEP-CTERM sorting domain-containing protein [Candidatus Eisenbacteria bacterium]|nr:PEP-CTERM sorting domain-containing protein [Candidatus Eisenbacteria bacterium]